jgi:hypothetical protein
LTREAIVSLDTGASPTSAAITSKLTAPTLGALGPVAERLLGIADKNHGLERGIEWRQVLHNGRQRWYEFYLPESYGKDPCLPFVWWRWS